MKIIDTHIHLFEKPYSDLFDNSHIKDGEDGETRLYEQYRKKHDIESAFVICYDEGHCPDNSRFVMGLARKRKWIHPFGYARPGPGSFGDNARAVIADGGFGVSCYLKKEDSGEWFCGPDSLSAMELLQAENAPLSLTVWPRQCAALGRALERTPQLTVLINHMGRPRLENGVFCHAEREPLRALSKYENVYVKLSGFYAFSENGWSWPQRDMFPVPRELLESFGEDRLLFASDFSPVLEYNTFRQTVETLRLDEAGFTEAALEKIYYHNAGRIISERKNYAR
jgi:predicted TIM-barrel fold metal-dependent hydrolase